MTSPLRKRISSCPHPPKNLFLRTDARRPEHKNKLGNEFLCYTNYEPRELGGWDSDEFPELFAAK